MKNRFVEKKEWKTYFDSISKIIQGNRIELEVAGLDIGDQIDAQWILLDEISYEPEEDIIFIHSPSLEHPIHHPLEVIAAEDDGAIKSMQIKDSKAHFHILQFRPPPKTNAGKNTNQEKFVNDDAAL